MMKSNNNAKNALKIAKFVVKKINVFTVNLVSSITRIVWNVELVVEKDTIKTRKKKYARNVLRIAKIALKIKINAKIAKKDILYRLMDINVFLSVKKGNIEILKIINVNTVDFNVKNAKILRFVNFVKMNTSY